MIFFTPIFFQGTQFITVIIPRCQVPHNAFIYNHVCGLKPVLSDMFFYWRPFWAAILDFSLIRGSCHSNHFVAQYPLKLNIYGFTCFLTRNIAISLWIQKVIFHQKCLTLYRHSCLNLGHSYTRRRINLYRRFFVDFSVKFQPIFMKFCMDYLRVTRRLPWNFHQKILYS